MHEDPRDRDSAEKTVKQLPKITDTTENLISEVADIVSRVGEAQSEIVMLQQRQGNRVWRLKKRQETHVVTCKASILQAGDTPEKEPDQLEDNIWDVCLRR